MSYFNTVGLAVNSTDVSQTNPLPVSQTRVVCAAADVHAPAVNTAAIVTYAADATKKHVITGVAWSYAGGTPVGGNLKIEDVSGNTVFWWILIKVARGDTNSLAQKLALPLILP